VLGYGSVTVHGGIISLKPIEFIARLTRSDHVIKVVDEEPRTIGHRIAQRSFMVHLPALVFLPSVTLAWDIHNLHDPRTSIFHAPLHSLDVFSKPIGMSVISYSVYAVSVMVVLVAIAGVAPSMVLPYFRGVQDNQCQ